MAFKCDNNWCTKFTINGCGIPEPRLKCPFLKLKQLQAIEKQAGIVREAQKQYFKSRSHQDLDKSKREENELDRLIMKYHQPLDYIQERFL